MTGTPEGRKNSPPGGTKWPRDTPLAYCTQGSPASVPVNLGGPALAARIVQWFDLKTKAHFPRFAISTTVSFCLCKVDLLLK